MGHVRISKVSGKTGGEKQLEVEQLQPRVINKLTVCFSPMTTIMPTVTDLTGLDNHNLEGQAQFNSGSVELLQGFLGRLPGPVCLVAHNGDRYDFPLLLAEMKKSEAGLSEEIYCVDSWLACKDILERRQKQIELQELQSVSELLSSGAFDEEFDEEFEEEPAKRRKTEDSASVMDLSRISASENETTPCRKKTEVQSSSRPRQPLITSTFKAQKRLKFPGSSNIPSFSLSSLHSLLLGVAPVQSHGAEADCLSLLRVTSTLGQDWVDYLNNNYKPLTAIKPMWNWQ